ncbi:MAG: RNA methyltransferase [Robiginitomaculum sp.]
MDKTIKDQLGNIVPRKRGTPPPVIILVNPQMGENIGTAARGMLNFGLSELRIVNPRDGWPSAPAISLAAGAINVLENAKVFETTAEAVVDLKYIMAATARVRELKIPVLGTQEAGAQYRAWQSQGQRTGVLFGPEKSGLKNDDIVLCDSILTYPVNPAFQSLNLGQAVSVFAYIWAASENTAPPELFEENIGMPADRGDLIRMFEHLEDELEKSGFFYPPEKRTLMAQNIRAPFTRAKMTEQEVRTMRGMIKAIARGRGKGMGQRDGARRDGASV